MRGFPGTKRGWAWVFALMPVWPIAVIAPERPRRM